MIRIIVMAGLTGLLAVPAAAQAVSEPAVSAPVVSGPVVSGPVVSAPAVWHATRTLLPGDIVQDDDVQAQPATRATAAAIPADRPVVGMEMHRRIAAGKPLGERDLGPRPAVRANAPVRVLWQANGIYLEITGRALEAGAAGEQIRVLNPATSRTLRGTVQADGTIIAQGGEP